MSTRTLPDDRDLAYKGHVWIDNGDRGALAHLAPGEPPEPSTAEDRRAATSLCGKLVEGHAWKSRPLSRACARCVDRAKYPNVKLDSPLKPQP